MKAMKNLAKNEQYRMLYLSRLDASLKENTYMKERGQKRRRHWKGKLWL